MIGVDWGTTSFRAFRLTGSGVAQRIERDAGIMHVPGGDFAQALRVAIGPWLSDGESRVLMSGMIGSRQGWVEAAYCACPAGAAELAAHLQPVPFEGAEVFIVPGLSAQDSGGMPEVMRGEETQIVGALLGAGAEGLVCLPGSHAKWAHVSGGRIVGFETYLSGEMFAAIRSATIIGRMMDEAGHDPEAFASGVSRSGDGGHLLHHVFGVRALGLFGRLSNRASASYLSGLLIGTEIRAAMPKPAAVTLLGAPGLCTLYAQAIESLGGHPSIGPADCAASGLAFIGSLARWSGAA